MHDFGPTFRRQCHRPRRRLGLLAALILGLCMTSTSSAADDPPESPAFFESRIRPVLVERCYSCHSDQAETVKAGLKLDSRDRLRAGGDSGPAVTPGRPDESVLIAAIEHADGYPAMPPKGDKLPEGVLKDFRRWVAAGAFDPRTSAPSPSANAAPSAPSRDWWSLKPIAIPDVPDVGSSWPRTPIDAFIMAELRAKGLEPAPDADRRTLIRRLFFDLTGLPPTPEDVSAFLDDPAPDAYERLVDRLLASPRYGERQARRWMDLVHFAETHGHDQDRVRPNAWPYRDYLIQAFNADTPFGRFIEEQLAADAIYPDEPHLIPALGFIAAGPWDESSLRDIREDTIDRQIGRYLDRDDMTTAAMSTFVSLTVHCARCHDHKFDPIPQNDYYGLQAVFAGVDRADRAYDPDLALHRKRQELKASKRDAELKALPPPKLVYAGASDFAPDGSHKPSGAPRLVHVLKRGDIHQPMALAAPSALSCVPGWPGRFDLPANAPESARRAALARWISDRRNPLTWRSIVNRVWQDHFGRGLVDTPNDFGRMGSPPSHPKLLDWLAATLRDSGGSLKDLHRRIVTSAVYRQSARHEPKFAAIDGDNRALWRMNRTRLDAESVRDAILQISGRLDLTMGGSSVQQFAMSQGVHVTPVVDYSRFDWDGPNARRRSVYRFLFRTLPDPFMDALDAADGSQLTATRSVSMSPLQALALLNNAFVMKMSERCAARLETAAGVGKNDGQIRAGFELILNRPATPDEVVEWRGYVARQGPAGFCRMLFNSNEFLFVN